VEIVLLELYPLAKIRCFKLLSERVMAHCFKSQWSFRFALCV